MNFLKLPRQPFVGLALMAGIGIVFADFFPIATRDWLVAGIIFATLAMPPFLWPNFGSTYLLVIAGFFLLHNLRTKDTPGLQLASDLTERPRVVRAVGFVMSEPKVASNGFGTFLLELESLEFEGELRRTNGLFLFAGVAIRSLATN